MLNGVFFGMNLIPCLIFLKFPLWGWKMYRVLQLRLSKPVSMLAVQPSFLKMSSISVKTCQPMILPSTFSCKHSFA